MTSRSQHIGWRRGVVGRRGQSLVEVAIGLAIGAIVIGAGAFAIAAMLRSSSGLERTRTASTLSQELLNKVRAVSSADWPALDGLEKGGGAEYHVATSGDALVVAVGPEALNVAGITYTRSFTVDGVCRLNNDRSLIEDCALGGTVTDPSTAKITVAASWPTGVSVKEVQVVGYVTRWRNAVFHQTDWSGTAGELGPYPESTRNYGASTGLDAASGSLWLQGF